LFYVSNAKQAATYYSIRFGCKSVAYQGLETGSRDVVTHVVSLNNIKLAFRSPLNPTPDHPIMQRIAMSGDLVHDLAFQVTDCVALYEKAMSRGAKSVLAPVEEKDANGSVIRATIQTGFSPTCHTFIQRNDYTGPFLPGFAAVTFVDPMIDLVPGPSAMFIDHVVTNVPDRQMNPACDWYAQVLDLHRFWTVDDSQVHTKYSALRSTVMTDFDRVIKLPINEPAVGLRKSQIQEYIDYHGGPGIQHVALNTVDLIQSVRDLKRRGVDFLPVPASYYLDLRKRLRRSPVEVKEDLDIIEELNILVDFDDHGYLLQLFTRPNQDRPTLFFEFIQRANHEGFGAGNFKSLFESIERDQDARGNLTSGENTEKAAE
jgi:4-hydroxyphenylpyruvate dioxygenase